jgi:hypothetical protein
LRIAGAFVGLAVNENAETVITGDREILELLELLELLEKPEGCELSAPGASGALRLANNGGRDSQMPSSYLFAFVI